MRREKGVIFHQEDSYSSIINPFFLQYTSGKPMQKLLPAPQNNISTTTKGREFVSSFNDGAVKILSIFLYLTMYARSNQLVFFPIYYKCAFCFLFYSPYRGENYFHIKPRFLHISSNCQSVKLNFLGNKEKRNNPRISSTRNWYYECVHKSQRILAVNNKMVRFGD